MYRQRLCGHILPTRFHADLPTEYDPVASIILPPERLYRWHRTAIYYRPTDRRALRLTTITTQRSHRTAI